MDRTMRFEFYSIFVVLCEIFSPTLKEDRNEVQSETGEERGGGCSEALGVLWLSA